MNLRNKVVIILVSIMALSTITYYLVFRHVILKSFIELDTRIAERNMRRCVSAFEREIKLLDRFVHDWSSWDDSYRFAIDRNQEYIKANLLWQVFQDQHLNLIHIYDAKGRLVWGKTYDLATEKEIPLDLASELNSKAFVRLIRQMTPGKSIFGIILTNYGPMAVASNPILTSENKGPSHGALIMGRFFTNQSAAMLSEQVNVKLNVWPARRDSIPKSMRFLVASLGGRNSVKLIEVSPDDLHAYAIIRDIADDPAILFEASLNREILQEGRWAYTFGMMSIIGAGIIMLVAVSGILQFVVLKPLAKLTENVLSIDESTKNIKGFVTGRKDEIGTLSREFDAMVQRLSMSEKHYRLLAENAHDIIFTMDTNLRFNYISPSITRIRGFTVEEAMCQTPAEALTPTSLEVAMKAFLEELEIEARETKDLWRTRAMELEETCKDGSTIWTETTFSPLRDDNNKFIGFLGITRDMSERKRAEGALRESQRRMSDIIDFLPDATFAIDRDGKVIAWNRAIEEMTGVPKQEILGKDHYAHAVPFYGEARPVLVDLLFQDQEDIKKKYDFVVRDGEKLVTEVFANRMYGGKGAYLWAIAAPLYDSSGQMVGAIECIRDITERKKAEELILLHSATIEQSLDGIVMVDLNNTIHYVNPAWAAMHGYAVGDLKGKHMRLFYTEEQMQSEVVPFFGQALEHGSMRGKLGHVKKDGTIFPTLVSAFLLKNDKGIPVALIVIARDITEELRMENQLHQAQKMEVVGQLAGGVAHDLNNMLSPVLGYTEMILMEMQPEDNLYEDLMQIKVSAERARNMTHQLLAFSRKQLLEMKVVDLAEVVASYGKMLRRTIREDIAIQMQGDVSRGAVRVDTDQIGQVLMNLAINAQDAMPQGGTISIETTDVILDAHYAEAHQGAVPGPHIMLSFSDTGMGMESRTIERIFEPFFTTKERGKGTGLGLATVYGIVKQHGGYIMVYSEPGMGTTFKIYLPRVDESPERLSECSTVRKGKSGTETLVVAEDDAGVRELVSNILEKHGYSVITAETNEMLIQVLNDHDGVIHMLLTDVIMPDMNGKELFEKLKPIYPEMKVIYMSGYTGNIIAHHGILEDGVHFIQKPFTMNMLTDKIRAVLDERTV